MAPSRRSSRKSSGVSVLDVPGWLKCRFTFALLGFLGIAILYALRVNLSVAIVTMVKKSNATTTATTSAVLDRWHGMVSQRSAAAASEDETCPESGTATASTTDSSDGDFEWDEGYQGFILSGFFYGYAVGQLPGGLLAERTERRDWL